MKLDVVSIHLALDVISDWWEVEFILVLVVFKTVRIALSKCKSFYIFRTWSILWSVHLLRRRFSWLLDNFAIVTLECGHCESE